jgi:hypothetical protein
MSAVVLPIVASRTALHGLLSAASQNALSCTLGLQAQLIAQHPDMPGVGIRPARLQRPTQKREVTHDRDDCKHTHLELSQTRVKSRRPGLLRS